MSRRPEALAITTGMGNNCSFHCLAHFIAKELLDPRKSPQEIEQLYRQPVYQALLRNVASYYNLANVTPEMFQNILKNYQNPIDREIFLGPVLRNQFKELLKEPRIMRPQLSTFSSQFKQDTEKYLQKLEIESQINAASTAIEKSVLRKQLASITYSNEYFVEANKDWLNNLHKDYKAAQLEYARAGQGKINVKDYVASMVGPDKIEAAYKRFADHVGNPAKQSYVDDHQLQLFAAEFGIKNLRVQMPEFDRPIDYFDRYDPTGKDLTVKIINRNHWEYLTDANEAMLHNRAYQNYNAIKDKLEAFIDPDALDAPKRIAARDQEIRGMAKDQGLKLVDFMINGDRAAINAHIKADIEKLAPLTPKGSSPGLSWYQKLTGKKATQSPNSLDIRIPPEKPKTKGPSH